MDEPVTPEEIGRALRSVRAATYRVDSTPDGPTLALVMNVSAGGRRNAATKMVRLLADHGLALDAADPAEQLTQHRDGLRVYRAAG